jgi:hypothetical protein
MQAFGHLVLTLWMIPLLLADFSVLPGNAPDDLLSPPTATAPIFIAIAISFSILFFITFTMISLRHKMVPKLTSALDNPMFQRLSAWVGFFGFLVGTQSSLSEMYRLDYWTLPHHLGLTAFLITRMWFGKAVDDFNDSIISQGQQGPQLIAAIGNGFTSESKKTLLFLLVIRI